MHFRIASFILALTLMGSSNGQQLPNGLKQSISEGQAARDRNQIVPLVAAHQHLLGPASVPEPQPSLPEIKLPADLRSLLEQRSRLSGSTEPTDLFTDDAIVLKLQEATWARGRSAIQTYLGFTNKGVVYIPNAYGLDGAAGYIAGGVRRVGSTHDDLNFLLALQRDSSSKWHIAAETDTTIAPPEFTKPVTADELVQDLDDAGIQKGVVLSIAYWYGSPLHEPFEDEYAKVREENDWTAQQVARYPERLVFFCGVNPLKEYAIAELERCAKMPQMKGIKLHFANSGVDVRDAKHLETLRSFFRAANAHKLAIVVHVRSLRGDYGRRDAEIFIKDVLPVAPDIPIQLAHMAGSGPGYGPDEAMAAYSEAIASGDPRTRNLYFDVTNCVTLKDGQSQEELALIAKRFRQAGLKRIFFGSDMHTDTSAPPGPWWVAFRRKLPLTNDELRVIANNIPPYMQ
jgi:predicted TIM-barrel fold metal-dependent hydrolase